MKSEKSKKVSKDYYVEPNEMWLELDAFYKTVAKSEDPTSEQMSDSLGKMIDDIATKLGFMGKFINYSFIDDMRGDARVKMVKAVYDQNFSLWNTFYCTPIHDELERNYVIVYSTKRFCWDDKKTYLKSWDTITTLEDVTIVENMEGDPLLLTYDNGNGTDVPVMHSITMKNNPFSYFTKIAFHAFVNRIKKEKKASEVLAAFQDKVYEEAYSSGNGWENVKRQALEDENEYYYNDNEEFFNEDADENIVTTNHNEESSF